MGKTSKSDIRGFTNMNKMQSLEERESSLSNQLFEDYKEFKEVFGEVHALIEDLVYQTF